MTDGALKVEPDACVINILEHTQRRQRGRAVGVDELEGDALDIFGQIGARNKNAIGDLVGIEFKQRRRIDIKVVDDYAIRLLRMNRQRRDDGQTAATGRIA